jgi:glucose-6-phosphate 1-dehydrogenase
MLPSKFRLVGFSRREWGDEEFREFLHSTIKKHILKTKSTDIESFLKHSKFQKGYFDDKNYYKQLDQTLKKIDIEVGVCTNKLFHLAVPPKMYEMIFKHLANSGLSRPCGGKLGWTRVLVEKPFGNDLKTAQALDNLLGKLYKEEQIFRIDHYLAKETLQNILAFRFSNVLFEKIWNKDYIEKIEIKLFEKKGIETRGDFYEATGALRDVGQNHVLQMLALACMDDPRELSAKAIRKARADILKDLEIINSKELKSRAERAQYKGYKNEKAVPKSSKTETYFKIHAHIKNKRWKHVPIILEAGKKMKKDLTEIKVHFKEKPTCVCELGDEQELQNVLTFHIQPMAGIEIRFWANKLGFGFQVEPRELSFDYPKTAIQDHLNDAYERVIFDCIRGDQTLFTSTEEVEASWRFITPILDNWHNTKLTTY